MSQVFTIERRVEFCETDAAGIAHFAAFLCYMEQAEHAFLRHLGTSVVQPLPGQEDASNQDAHAGWHLSWPRVHVECDYSGAARFEEVLCVDVRLLKLGEKSVTYGFQFRRAEQTVASGKVVAVCCKVAAGQPLVSQPIPEELRAKLQPYVSAAS